jgi:3-methyladenine DNA glycosylase Tag
MSMIELQFAAKAHIIKIIIKDRIITMIAPQLGNAPVQFDVNKAAQFQDERMTELLKEVGIKDFSEFDNDNACAKSIVKDFQESGWRMVKRRDI